MPKCTMLVGLPASGKSTWREKNDTPSTHVYSTDDIVEEIAEANGKTYDEVWQTAIKLATKVANRDLADAIHDRRDIILDRTNLTKASRRKLLSMLPGVAGYTVKCVCFVPPSTPCEWAEYNRRLASREGKSIPMNVILKMAEDFELPCSSEGFDVVWMYNIFGEPIDD